MRIRALRVIASTILAMENDRAKTYTSTQIVKLKYAGQCELITTAAIAHVALVTLLLGADKRSKNVHVASDSPNKQVTGVGVQWQHDRTRRDIVRRARNGVDTDPQRSMPKRRAASRINMISDPIEVLEAPKQTKHKPENNTHTHTHTIRTL
jgi:hypothetical protein